MFGQSPTPAPSPAATTNTAQEEDDMQLAIAMSLNEQWHSGMAAVTVCWAQLVSNTVDI